MHVHAEKKAVLTRKLNGIIYELLVKTHSDMVYVGEKVTLTEKWKEFADLITQDKELIDDIEEKFDELYRDAPENFNTFKEIWDYVNVDGDPKSALIELIDSKVEKEEGKGLSECDFTQVLKALVENDYTPEQIDDMFVVVGQRVETVEVGLNDVGEAVERLETKNNVILDEDTPEDLLNGDVWYQVVRVES